MKKITLLSLVIISAFLFTNCKKEGPEGSASIAIQVVKDLSVVPGAEVGLYYGATSEAGGTADEVRTADTLGRANFTNLREGNYYLSATATVSDSSSSSTLTGGIAVQVESKTQIVDTLISL